MAQNRRPSNGIPDIGQETRIHENYFTEFALKNTGLKTGDAFNILYINVKVKVAP